MYRIASKYKWKEAKDYICEVEAIYVYIIGGENVFKKIKNWKC